MIPMIWFWYDLLFIISYQRNYIRIIHFGYENYVCRNPLWFYELYKYTIMTYPIPKAVDLFLCLQEFAFDSLLNGVNGVHCASISTRFQIILWWWIEKSLWRNLLVYDFPSFRLFRGYDAKYLIHFSIYT